MLTRAIHCGASFGRFTRSYAPTKKPFGTGSECAGRGLKKALCERRTIVFIDESGQVTTAGPTIFAHAGQDHQIAGDDQGQPGSVARLDRCHLADATGKPKDGL